MYEKEVLKKNNSPFNVGIVFLEPLLPSEEFEEMRKLDEEMRKLDEEMKSIKFRLFIKCQVIFLELLYLSKKLEKNGLKWKINKNGLKLDFDANACSYLLLQMNQIQNLFVFQVIVPNTDIILPIKPIKENIDICWFESIANKILNDRKRSTQNFDERVALAGNDKIIRSEKHAINFCIGIISERIVIKNQKNSKILTDKYFMTIGKKRSYPVSLISSYLWDRNYSPPSLFEYLINSVLISTLFSTFLYFGYKLDFHVTESSGCIFDITGRKSDRKILVSNSNICPLCQSKIKELERKINMEKENTPLYEIIKKVLAMDWVGDINKRNSPLYNLQRNYGYNIDRNSGFNKKWWEKIRDNMIENVHEWTIGAIITVGTALLISIFRLG